MKTFIHRLFGWKRRYFVSYSFLLVGTNIVLFGNTEIRCLGFDSFEVRNQSVKIIEEQNKDVTKCVILNFIEI